MHREEVKRADTALVGSPTPVRMWALRTSTVAPRSVVVVVVVVVDVVSSTVCALPRVERGE